MTTLERHARYACQRGVATAWLDEVPAGLTGPQQRRLRHKAGCRKTHQHFPGKPCPACRPEAQPPKVPFRPFR